MPKSKLKIKISHDSELDEILTEIKVKGFSKMEVIGLLEDLKSEIINS